MKLVLQGKQSVLVAGFARQKWRAWIETAHKWCIRLSYCRFARQKWRAWIETPARWKYGLELSAIRPPEMEGVD